MSDVIHLLPDSVANQIAAGEVIQRPASVVKELIENSVDAQATHIQVIIKEAGRTLVQVIDNGKGMSETDARFAFERHATSKIENVNDLFSLRTMGFRGEALASIASIAHVELNTRREEDELGTKITIAGGKVESQEMVSCPQGCNFSVKNLFYNVPARRKFLKTNSREFSHIETEFFRVALVCPGITFELWHNEQQCYMLPVTGLRERIVKIFGRTIHSQLLSFEAHTSFIKIHGFAGKPETAKKQNNRQYFFVNGRYMRHGYFHRAVVQAYDKILMPNTSPDYFIYFEIDPNCIDVNIHPTKTEIKFENEQAIWPIILAAVKEALGRFNVAPPIDFDQEGSVPIPVLTPGQTVQPPKVNTTAGYNPFNADTASFVRPKMENWNKLYEDFEGNKPPQGKCIELSSRISDEEEEENRQETPLSHNQLKSQKNTVTYFQLKNKYILTSVRSGLMCIDQHRAHVRVLFNRFFTNLEKKRMVAQQLLFPERLELLASEVLILAEIKEELAYFGFDISNLGGNSYAINSMPTILAGKEAKPFVIDMLDAAKNLTGQKSEMLEMAALSLAEASAIPAGQSLSEEEMNELVNNLFTCPDHHFSPSGKPIIVIMSDEEIDKMFK